MCPNFTNEETKAQTGEKYNVAKSHGQVGEWECEHTSDLDSWVINNIQGSINNNVVVVPRLQVHPHAFYLKFHSQTF